MAGNVRRRILVLLRLFDEKTDEQHTLTMPEIITELERNGITADRRAVYEDIEELTNMGWDIVRELTGKRGYFLAYRLFEDPEINIIADSLRSSRFLSEQKTTRMLSKLEKLASPGFRKRLSYRTFITSRPKGDNSNVLYGVRGDEDTIVIPEGVEVISMNTFHSSEVKKLQLPESLKRIERYAFCSCDNLTSVKIPDGVERIDAFAFSGCRNLKEIILPESLKRIRNSCFYDDDSLECVNIPDSVTRIGPQAFAYCTALTEVTLPAGLKEILDKAFRGCEKITSIEIPEGTEFIGAYAFSECDALESIVLHESIEEIDDVAFLGCTSLKSITLPRSLKRISESAFCDCSNLMEIRMPEGVEVFEDNMADVFENGNCAVRTGKGQIYFYGDPYLAEKKTDNPFKGCSRVSIHRY